MELLLETIPKLRQVAVLSNPANPTGREAAKETEVAGRTLGVRVRSFKIVRESNELEREFAAIVRERPGALIVIPDPLIIGPARNARIAELALRNRLPAMGGERGFVAAGGLISYGGDFLEGWRLAARYVDKILKGAKPAELPVEQPTKFELVINLKTAKALGLTIPQSLLLQATEVIE